MARRHEGFTIAVIPHSAHGKRRELRVSGAGAPLFRTAVALVVIAIAASVYISVSGVVGQSRLLVLNRRIESLQDSLARAADISARLESIEAQLEEIRATRRVIENLATQGAPPADQ
ncbi:MAG: hypothetical protein R6V62_07565 [Candidatus Fermentibacteraceae bacterium]